MSCSFSHSLDSSSRWFSTRLTGNSEYCPSTAERWCCPEHRNCTPVWSSWAEGERRSNHWSTAINKWKQMHIGQQYKVVKWSTATACVSKNRTFMLCGVKLMELAKKMWCFSLALQSTTHRQQSWWMSDWLFTFLFGKCDVWKHRSNENLKYFVTVFSGLCHSGV